MNYKSFFFFSLIVILWITCSQKSFSQDTSLYIPRNILKAYHDSTRAYNGAPGSKYWQNRADYKIDVKLDPPSRIVTGHEIITFFNESPNTLKSLVFRLYQNLYKKGNIRDIPIDSSDLTDGVKIYEMIIDSNKVDLSSNSREILRKGTNLFVRLKKPFFPKDTMHIQFKWSFKLPFKTDIRMGAKDSTSFFVGYWYPQISVYDDIDGWDTFAYTAQQEFYNNYGNFEVSIQVPKNFIVWATGVLQNPDSVLNNKYYRLLEKAKQSDSVIHIITADDLKKKDITVDKERNTWKFKAKNVTDFAFAISNHYLWDAGSVIVDSSSGRRTLVETAYPETVKTFQEVCLIAMQSVDYFSIKIPGIPFPYPTMTIFNGARKTGMAYPMIVNDYDTPGNNGAIMVTSREIVHTYFPFYVGVNEQKYAWMDEGWATSLPADFQFYFGHVDPRIWDAKAYEYYAGDEMEMPVMIPSELLRGGSFGLASYLRAGEAFLFLRNMLGNKLFKKVLDTFIQRWHGKHPIPYDLFFTFNNVTNENLDWYWKSWFFEPGYPDLGIKSVKIDSSKAIVTVERIGSIPVPVYLRVTFESGTIDTVYRTAKVWKDGKKEISFKITFLPQKKIGSIRLGVPAIPDVNRKNNYFLNQPKPYKMPETNKKKGTKKKKKKKKLEILN